MSNNTRYWARKKAESLSMPKLEEAIKEMEQLHEHKGHEFEDIRTRHCATVRLRTFRSVYKDRLAELTANTYAIHSLVLRNERESVWAQFDEDAHYTAKDAANVLIHWEKRGRKILLERCPMEVVQAYRELKTKEEA